MPAVKSARRTQKTSKKNVKNTRASRLRTRDHKWLPAFVAGFSGAALAIALMMMAVVPIMKNEFSAEASSLNQKVLSMAPASETFPAVGSSATTCVAQPSEQSKNPSSNNAKPAIQAAVHQSSSTTKPINNTGATPGSHAKYVSYLFGNLKANNQGSNSYTGADSVNKVTATNTNTTTVTNDNDINLTNNNSQSAHSGDVDSSQNTTTGNVSSGDVSNNSTSTFSVKIDNN